MSDDLITFIVRCDAVVTQGVDKILVVMTDAQSVPEEQMIFNIAQRRGVMKIGADYLVTVAKLRSSHATRTENETAAEAQHLGGDDCLMGTAQASEP
jgi:hypothetical protein